ncbi:MULTISPECIES: indole-3-glycerol phosphate synthase TrpC [Aerococcus]|uniref:Indole-3-glycerol phosphate synthase n=1 Tax=Aerococcus sanguinicola TaxID=119206 RepID=A0A5N1GI33_9LACT|nr:MULTISPECIES: indole-3-glycerol phosphate synthase TrpC [Aerococcus]KAA9299621.1 indole-3-glycerol phosphate synthase TrpC [Aerococcus sanguinicola]MDK6369990.1 indole-3-glycerol phosphate synthase TrpC [Aerococcus sp. UMB9870]MDK6680536.1 indole-3-glycerol phosphate synthase TrpC [Aerococcus sp. UMB8608]MDK6687366.1 indole-3-glycerol phosphate synthase TrpC [Aerococcus sp. UMB8623]MDK6940513.1 indole-3-glycerol phosphate synthase TrpC [Aerococcus sp. UMB8487]
MILDDIVQKRKERYQSRMAQKPLAELEAACQAIELSQEAPFPFYETLSQKDHFHFICECKKASPSKGLIAGDYHPADIARSYQEAGASAISVLTEPDFFQGSDQDLQAVRQASSLAILRKDFIFTAYQIYEAKLLGANAVLLIVSILSDQDLDAFQKLAHSLNLDALVECHDLEEIERAKAVGARIIGVNNRDLKTFTVDLDNTQRLRQHVPEEIVFIAESGVSQRNQVAQLEAGKVNALLIGESLMRAEDKGQVLAELRGDSHD